MRIGILGGTFHPVHSGHVRLANTCIEGLSLDRLLVIPTFVPPHKTAPDLVSGEHRLAMCRIAFADCGICEVSDMELRREQASYTVETLRELKTAHPERELFLLMGSDMFLTLCQWYRWEEIITLAEICACSRERPGDDPALLAHCEQLRASGAKCTILQTDPLVISSTALREMLAAGEDTDAFLPSGVREYIAQHRLYRASK